MNIRLLVFLLFTVVTLYSCDKITPGFIDKGNSFDATVDATNISINDSASFSLIGNADIITFYSGQTGNNFDYRDRTFLSGGQLKMKFETRVVNQPADTLEVFISTDFNGVYDSANVASATWNRITDKFLFPDATTPLGTFISSGPTPGDLTDISANVIPGKPFYLAYRYDITKQNNIEWSIGKLGMYNFFSNGNATSTVIDSSTNNSGSFAPVSFGEPSRWTKTTTYYKCINSSTSTLGASHWYISKPLNPDAIAPDLPIVVKNITQSPLAKFKFKYSTPGTYKAVLIGSYQRLHYEKVFAKEFFITVQ